MTNPAWQELVVHVLQILSILSAGAFAALALFTEYKKDGKVTTYGRIAVIGIVLSAVCSLGTRWAQSSLDADRSTKAKSDADAQRALQSRQFNAQMSNLQTMLGRLENVSNEVAAVREANAELRNGMDESLQSQRGIQGSVRRTLSATASLSRQGYESTTRLLRTMWDDSNYIRQGGIELIAMYHCDVTGGRRQPELFSANSLAEILVLPAGQTEAAHLFGFGPNLTDLEGQLAPDGTGRVAIRFNGFIGTKSDVIASPDAWRNARITVRVSSPLKLNLSELNEMLEEPLRSAGEVHEDDLGGYPRDGIVAEVPCQTEFYLMVNGRMVTERDPSFLILNRPGGMVATLVVNGVESEPDAFREFGSGLNLARQRSPHQAAAASVNVRP